MPMKIKKRIWLPKNHSYTFATNEPKQNSIIGFSKSPKTRPVKIPDTTAFASLSISPPKNPTLRMMAIIKETHENPMSTPSMESIIATTSETIVGFII